MRFSEMTKQKAVGIGLVLGLALGAATNHIAVGIGIGAVFGYVPGEAIDARAKREGRRNEPGSGQQ
jgi:ABC-type dipeptide/oligopeptide/nickel transport system permease subunit